MSELSKYTEFLEQKIDIDAIHGFDVKQSDIHPLCKPHQRDIVQWAVRGGRRAIFASFGLGKSIMQLEIMRLIAKREGGRQLIICPLGVRQEFKIDAAKLGLKITFIRRTEEVGGPGLYLTNYESVRDGRLDVNPFNAASLDEAGCLRSYGSKTYQSFLKIFRSVQYRYVATATPSPNRDKELIHYAGYLGVMDTGQALTRYFKRDSTKANNLTLNPHMERKFWLWVASWAIFIQKPSDLGYSDDGYILPGLTVRYHEVKSTGELPVDRNGQMGMFRDAALSLQDASREKRNTLPQRIEKMVELIKERPADHVLLWHDQEKERHAIKKAVPDAVEIYGSQPIDLREQRVIDFSNGKIKYFATKPQLSGSGCNFQRHCHWAIFLGIGFKFHDFIQSIHRIYRFLQDHQCTIDIIYADSEKRILDILKKKWAKHERMVQKMTELIKKYGLSNSKIIQELKRTIGVERIEVSGNGWKAVNNDTVQETASMKSGSIDLIHTSIPFANHYEYTPSYNDFGYTESNAHFWQQMDFLTPHLFRILKPGRIAAIHIKDRILFGNVTGLGFPTCDNMLEETSFHFQKHGFKKIGIITVVTDVVRENNQTYRLGWTEQCKDGSKMGVGCPEYILIFRKPQTDLSKGYADDPVTKSKDEYTRARWQVDAHAFWRSSGDRLLTPDEMAKMGPQKLASLFTKQSLMQVYDYESHVKIGDALELKGALPSTFMAIAPGSHHPNVWHDVIRMRTLNGEQAKRNLQSHLCPLQFDIVDRIITRYSNKGDTVYDPFGGLMTIPYRALKLGRKGLAVELNHQYFLDGVKYCQSMEIDVNMPTLFDDLEEDAA